MFNLSDSLLLSYNNSEQRNDLLQKILALWQSVLGKEMRIPENRKQYY